MTDSRWTFKRHFEVTGDKLRNTAAKLSRILPNIGRPNNMVRRLHASVVDSIALYAAPIWTDKVMRSRKIQGSLNQVQRKIACRTIRGYRTIGHSTASMLAGMTPLHLKGDMYTEVYEELKDARAGGVRDLPPQAITLIRNNARNRMFLKWEEWTRNYGWVAKWGW
ncbi:PREDICTED: uncharacterized protein LOC108781384 [Cyphomyrmex costatus]|uniref:uncharacterized protein LOC108781384 n=1 Tax=Cyphomyrmex costatus TaxID=456900 RepID=UPI000852461B|nr:PREDICTED: uncharacterized protein LOC108781384 [Cyphomyrmex costatus]